MKIALSSLLLVGVAWIGAQAQGTVRFDNNIPGLLVTHVYFPSLPSMPQIHGNAPNDTPPGTQNYTGYVPLEGQGWSAQLVGAPGADRREDSLEPALSITTFQTGPNAGFLVPVTATFANIPPDAAVATLQLRVWNNA